MSTNPYELQYDAQGRAFFEFPGQPRNYVSPVAMGTGTPPPGGASYLHMAPQWNQNSGGWERPINWGNLLSTAVGATIAGPAVVSAFGGGGAPAFNAAGYFQGPSTFTGAAAGGGSRFASMLPGLIGKGIDAGFGAWQTNKQISANDKSAQAQADAAKYGADLQAKAAADQLAYLKEQSARDEANQLRSQQLNYDIYGSERQTDYDKWLSDRQQQYDQWAANRQGQYDQWAATRQGQYDQWAATTQFDADKYAAREKQLAPYRGIGQGATTTLSQLLGVPIVQQPAPPPFKMPALPTAPPLPTAPGLPNMPGLAPLPSFGGSTSALPSSDLQDIYTSVSSQGAPTAGSLDQLAEAYRAKGHQVTRPTYNGVPSGNELIVNGQKLKFTVGDVGQPNTSWYQWGTNDLRR